MAEVVYVYEIKGKSLRDILNYVKGHTDVFINTLLKDWLDLVVISTSGSGRRGDIYRSFYVNTTSSKGNKIAFKVNGKNESELEIVINEFKGKINGLENVLNNPRTYVIKYGINKNLEKKVKLISKVYKKNNEIIYEYNISKNS